MHCAGQALILSSSICFESSFFIFFNVPFVVSPMSMVVIVSSFFVIIIRAWRSTKFFVRLAFVS